MFNLKNVLLGVGLLSLSGLTIAKVLCAQSVPDSATAAQLIAIAKATLNAQNEVRVTGDINTAVTKSPLALSFQPAIHDHLERSRRGQAGLAASKQGFTGFKTDLTVKKIQVNGNTATLDATELSQFGLGQEEDLRSHKQYKYSLEHRFNFVLQNGQWVLSSDQELNAPDTYKPPKGTPQVPPNAIKLQIDPPN
ncbi:MAG: hypothetical protein H0X31_00145 [Nostocaceae cyanobacterium]|nr:hypothetical protein [Nostocaceae cyanobacterium]